jgi:putative phosphoesterase
MRRLGVVADTHCERVDARDLPDAVLATFQNTDLIVHCGDLMKTGVLERLAQVAPVVAVRSSGDPPADGHPWLREPPYTLEADGVRIGVLSRPADLIPEVAASDGTDVAALSRHASVLFGGDVDIVLYRGSHRDQLDFLDGTLFLDPGSPTWWAGQRATVFTLDVHDGAVGVTLIDLTSQLTLRRRFTHYLGSRRQRRWNSRGGQESEATQSSSTSTPEPRS